MTITAKIAIGVAVVLLLLFWMMVERSLFLSRKLKPKISATYDHNSDDCCKLAHMRALPDGPITQVRSIRVKIDCDTEAHIEQCSAFLTKMEYRAHGGEFSELPFYEPQYLNWAMEEPKQFAPVTVFPGVSRYFGVCMAKENESGFRVRTKSPSLVTPEIFPDIGEYRLSIRVVAAHCGTLSLTFLVDWNGKWNELKASLKHVPWKTPKPRRGS